ncbi:putative oxidoreductase SadH [Coriobacteriaceae bacterium EMTCatB1]|nr:putative oxidoreductase SadH [Coriobacteriaceae bacterium EMTCatB1]
MRLAGKTVVVTGGGNGIGRELVLQLLKRGARAAAVDINDAALAETASLAGADAERLSTHAVNITDRSAVEALPEAVLAAHGQVDGLINCAGIIQPFVKLNDLGYDAIERVMNVNFWGVVNMTKTFLPHLLARPEAHIANVSSMGGFLPVPGQTAYGASKAAVKLLTEGLRSELMATPVRVTVIFPGAIGTDIAKHSGVEAPGQEAASQEASKIPVTPPAEAARVILDGIEADTYRVLIGKDAKTMDLLTRLMPDRAAKLIYKQMRSLLPE